MRAAALRAAYRQADLIPDHQAEQWAQLAFDEAKRGIDMPFGPSPALSGYEVLQGLANRFPDTLIPQLLADIDPLLPRDYGHYRPMDDQIAHTLIGLGRNNPAHYAEVADRIATVFERADDLAAIIVDADVELSSATDSAAGTAVLYRRELTTACGFAHPGATYEKA